MVVGKDAALLVALRRNHGLALRPVRTDALESNRISAAILRSARTVIWGTAKEGRPASQIRWDDSLSAILYFIGVGLSLGGSVTSQDRTTGHGLSVTSTGFGNLLVWTPGGEAGMFCIELVTYPLEDP